MISIIMVVQNILLDNRPTFEASIASGLDYFVFSIVVYPDSHISFQNNCILIRALVFSIVS